MVELGGKGNGRTGDAALRWMRLARLMHPGLGLKRWLLVGAFGIAVCSVGLALLVRRLTDLTFPDFLPFQLEGVLLLVVGIGTIVAAMYGLVRSIGPIVFEPSTLDGLADTIYTRRSLSRGPRIVAIGGGTGLSVLLRGLKTYTSNLTAIITVADDGGSSGRLRKELGVPPPGDFRNCLVAMSDTEPLLADLFQYRFDQGNGLKGHSFGNLFIAAMTEVTESFDQALYESSRVLAVHGRIVPSTVANLGISASFEDGTVVRGESAITERRGRIDRLLLDPEDAKSYPLAAQAIEQAQMIVIGPGSLYTSILPNLLVAGISRAIGRSGAPKVYVCNVATQMGETDGYTVADHVDALQRHTFPEIADYVLANGGPQEFTDEFPGTAVTDDGRPIRHAAVELRPLVDREHPIRHDTAALSSAVMDIFEGRLTTAARTQTTARA